jgi:hypothetical protein
MHSKTVTVATEYPIRISKRTSTKCIELAETFNHCLQDMDVAGVFDPLQRALTPLLHQNQPIRLLDENLQERHSHTETTTNSGTSYHLPELYLWPISMACISSKPSLIYRFVRHGNLEGFVKQVLRASRSNGGGAQGPRVLALTILR